MAVSTTRTREVDVHGDGPSRLFRSCLDSAPCRWHLDARMTDVVELLEGPGWPHWLAAEASRTEADCMADPRSEEGAEGCADGRESVAEFIAERPPIVRARLEGAP
jgi:hypothetical protein